jgi:hypothetical protein
MDEIQPGDVFVKQWGKTEMVIVMLPRTSSSAKQHFMRLHRGTTESTWATQRANLVLPWRKRRGWRYVGTIPEQHLNYLRRNWTLR